MGGCQKPVGLQASLGKTYVNIDSAEFVDDLLGNFGNSLRVVDGALEGNNSGVAVELLLEFFSQVNGLVVGVVEHGNTRGGGFEESLYCSETDTATSTSDDAVLSASVVEARSVRALLWKGAS